MMMGFRFNAATRKIASASFSAFLAAGSGILLVLALPPTSQWWVAAMALSTLYVLLQGRSIVSCLSIGYAFGLGFFGFGTFWITESFAVDAERFGLFALPAVAALSALLALFLGATCAVFAALRPPHGRFLQGAIFAVCWGSLEWVRGHILTGFPWNLAAYVTADHAAFRQLAALTGSYGLSVLVVWLAILPGVVFLHRTAGMAATATITAVLMLIAVWTFGSDYMAAPAARNAPTLVRIVQGNVPQTSKWDPDHRQAIIERYLGLSASPGRFDVLVWPETAYPGFLAEDDDVRKRIASFLPEGSYLLVGSPLRHEINREPIYHNAILVMRSDGAITDVYAKHHLVPFGEYVPFKAWLPFGRMVESLGDFTPGEGPQTMDIGRFAKPAAAICYEAIFPGHVVKPGSGAGWIVNVTNDAWFGNSIGPHQHLAAARMRAVEEGLPLIRAANTGISVAADAHGRSIAMLGLMREGIIDVALPSSHGPTPYARFGHIVLLAVAGALLAFASMVDLLLNRKRPFGAMPST